MRSGAQPRAHPEPKRNKKRKMKTDRKLTSKLIQTGQYGPVGGVPCFVEYIVHIDVSRARFPADGWLRMLARGVE